MDSKKDLEEIIKYIREKKAICPTPIEWNYLFTHIFKGWEEFEFGSDEINKYKPLILGGWGPFGKKLDKHGD